MRIIFAAVMVGLLIVPAYPQASKFDLDGLAKEKKQRNDEIDKQYKSVVRSTDGKEKGDKADPWGQFRKVEPAKTEPVRRPGNSN